MVRVFFDNDGTSVHDQFQAWRANHQNGTLLSLTTRTRAKLHGTRCLHLGSGPPYFLLADGFGSLTRHRKVCGAELQLLAWAAENGVSVEPCHDCLRDQLISDRLTSHTPIVNNNAAEDQGMARFWTCHWRFRYWGPDHNREGQPVRSSGSDSFRKKGISVGDIVYVVSLKAGQLYLGGRMTVKQIVSKSVAVRLLNNDNLYDAEEWIVDPDDSGTLLHLHRRLSPALTKQLRFKSKAGPQELVFVSDNELDNQTTRGVRELTPESAGLLDRIIEVTDRLPKADQLVTVTEKSLNNVKMDEDIVEFRLSEEVPGGSAYSEGSVQRILVNRYERDPEARKACIKHYGTTCFCGFDFVAKYGQMMAGFIHVHHLKPLSSVGADYKVDHIRDLRPVCPNCHAVLHRREPPYSIDEVRELLQARKE